MSHLHPVIDIKLLSHAVAVLVCSVRWKPVIVSEIYANIKACFTDILVDIKMVCCDKDHLLIIHFCDYALINTQYDIVLTTNQWQMMISLTV